MNELTAKDELLIANLHNKLGDAYHQIITDLFDNYRVISIDPVRVRAVAPTSKGGLMDIGVDPNSARFFYLVSAIKSQRDAFDKSKTATVKYNAHRMMLENYKTARSAMDNNWLQLLSYFPSELDKIVKKFPHIFRVEHSRAPSPKAVAVYLVNVGFDLAFLENKRLAVIDPFEYSKDDVPELVKPLAKYPPHIAQTMREKELKEEQERPWDLIADDE